MILLYTIFPSTIGTMVLLNDKLSNKGSCVAITMVLPILCNFLSISMNKRELSLSRLAVGSSQSIMFGLATKALAMAVRCFSPPESLLASSLLFMDEYWQLSMLHQPYHESLSFLIQKG